MIDRIEKQSFNLYKFVSNEILKTKLYIPPARPNQVSRPRLVARLEQGLIRKLTLISAPAGFGKTSVLAEWVRQGGCEFAWLSLDAQDNDPIRFLSYLIAAVQTTDPDLGQSTLAIIKSPRRPPMESLVNTWINDLTTKTDDIVLILDDFHAVEAEPVQEIVTYLLEHLPPKIHLVLATRIDPFLPIGKLRGDGELNEIRAEDLRFTLEETSDFLDQQLDIQISPEEISTINTRTEGWIAGLQIAAVSMQGQDDVSGAIRDFMGSDRYVLDYLVEEVLLRQPDHIQRFLFQTSILDRLSGALCDAVLGEQARSKQAALNIYTPTQGFPGPEAPSQEILEHLDRSNLFLVPLDNERRWYRYHHLFSDLLRYRLEQTQPDLIPSLHSRAGAWFAQNGFMSEAIEHALRAGDPDWAASLVEDASEPVMLRSEFATLLRWVETLPEGVLRTRPRLSVYRALAMVLSGQSLDLAMDQLQVAIKADVEGTAAGDIIAFRALIAAYQGKHEQSASLAMQALDRLSEDSLFFRSFISGFLGFAQLYRGDVQAAQKSFQEAIRVSERVGDTNIAVLARHHLGDLYALQGEAGKAVALYQEALDRATDEHGNRQPIAGIALIGLGRLATERFKLNQAPDYLTQGIPLIEKWGEAGAISGYTGLARVKQAQGDPTGALEAARTAEEIAERFDAMEVDDVSVAICQARLWLMQGDLQAAARWADGRSLDSDLSLDKLYKEIGTAFSFYRVIEYTTLAWIRIVQNRIDEALQVLDVLIEATEDNGWRLYSVEAMILKAMALQAQGKAEDALPILEHAISIAAPGGYVYIFLEKGVPIAQLLYKIAQHGSNPVYAKKLLAAFEHFEAACEQPSTTVEQPLIEPLSERELEVLGLLAEGLSNQEIANRLVLSLSTVKAHNYSIYGKLNVQNRTRAVARARALGILPLD